MKAFSSGVVVGLFLALAIVIDARTLTPAGTPGTPIPTPPDTPGSGPNLSYGAGPNLPGPTVTGTPGPYVEGEQ